MPSSAALPPGYAKIYASFYKQLSQMEEPVDNQYQNYNRIMEIKAMMIT